MMRKLGFMMAGVLLVAGTARAAVNGPDRQLFDAVAKSVNHYAQFSIFDNVDASVKNGVVTLTGQVTMPYKRDEIAKRIARLDGVTTVRNGLSVLPVSQFDDRLRLRVARSIYGNGNFSNYGLGPNPSIHIIVQNSRVTLTGVVNSDVDRRIAGDIATHLGGVMSVTNNLKTNAEAKDALERS
jgi:hypothetical protein